VWEMLHERALSLVREGEAIERDEWQDALLSWDAWTSDEVAVTDSV
jgi:hypothetical protein